MGDHGPWLQWPLCKQTLGADRWAQYLYAYFFRRLLGDPGLGPGGHRTHRGDSWPGASVWGANAVNGIINIITKSAEDTQGGLVSLTAGDEERVIAGVRYGGPLGEQGSYRVYGKHFERDGLVDESGRDAGDDWDLTRGGFRVDWAPFASDTIMAQGDLYDGDIDQNFTVPSLSSPTGGQRVLESGDASGGSLLARWEHVSSLASRVSVQFYYERFRRNDTFQNERRDTFDYFQHELALTKRQEFIWGLGYRLSSDHITPAELVSVSPEERDLHLASGFFQHRIALFDDLLDLSFGTKLEYHTFSGWEYQPNVRTIWKPHRNHRLWASFSRATRTPSRGEIDADVRFLGIPQLQSIVVLEGNPDFGPERVLSYELGYRTWPKKIFTSISPRSTTTMMICASRYSGASPNQAPSRFNSLTARAPKLGASN